MHCDDARGRADELSDGGLTSTDADAVRAHLEGCDACRAFQAQERDLVEALSTDSDLPAPRGFDERVLDEILERNRRPVWPWAAAAATVALALLVWILPTLRPEPVDPLNVRRAPQTTSVVLEIVRATDDGRSGRSRVAAIDGEPIAYLLERADVIVRGRVLAASGATLNFEISQFVRGTASDLTTSSGVADDKTQRRCVSSAQWIVGEDVVLFLRHGADGRFETVRGQLGKQTLPIDDWMPLDVLNAFANGQTPSATTVAQMVRDQGTLVLSRLQSVGDVRSVIDPGQLFQAAESALLRIVSDKPTAAYSEYDEARAINDLVAVLRFYDPPIPLRRADLQAVQPRLRAWLASLRDVPGDDHFPVARHSLEDEPAWASAVLVEHVDATIPSLRAEAANRLPPDLTTALRLLAQLDAEAARVRAREVVETVSTNDARRDALELLLDLDRASAEDEIVRRARMETWSKRERVIAFYAPLLLRIDRPEARMLLRSALAFLAADAVRHDAFVTALRRDDAEAARDGLAVSFVEEAERFENAMQRSEALYARQAFFLRCHIVCGGTLDTFAGWLPRVLAVTPQDSGGERKRLILLRALEETLGQDVLRWKSPTPKEADAAAERLIEILGE